MRLPHRQHRERHLRSLRQRRQRAPPVAVGNRLSRRETSACSTPPRSRSTGAVTGASAAVPSTANTSRTECDALHHQRRRRRLLHRQESRPPESNTARPTASASPQSSVCVRLMLLAGLLPRSLVRNSSALATRTSGSGTGIAPASAVRAAEKSRRERRDGGLVDQRVDRRLGRVCRRRGAVHSARHRKLRAAVRHRRHLHHFGIDLQEASHRRRSLPHSGSASYPPPPWRRPALPPAARSVRPSSAASACPMKSWSCSSGR